VSAATNIAASAPASLRAVEHVDSTTADVILTRIEQTRRRPLRAMIEISDRCNEVCVHCYQVQGQKGEMTTVELKDVIDELARMGVLILTLSGGEATLRKDFLEIVAHARMRGFAVRLFTNGLTMTEALARRLGDLAVHVVEISLYSHRAEVHDFVTGVPGSFERTVGAVRRLVAAGVDTHVKTPLMRVNEDGIDGYVALAESLGATFAIDPDALMAREGGQRAPASFSRSPDGLRSVLRDPRFGTEAAAKRAPRPLSAPPCGAGESIHVEPNGELRPCTMLEVPLGSALSGIGAARATDARLKGILGLTLGDVHGCRDCDLRVHCFRCHAAALAEVGDALAPYPAACADARAQYELASGRAPRVARVPGRDGSIGPYRETSTGTFEPCADVITPADDALAARLGWVRRALPVERPPRAVAPGALVQIRRPGRTGARRERVPPAERPHAGLGERAGMESHTLVSGHGGAT
jgi:radical SAM protein with 4Fe4S-binding SPASM domain